MISQFSIHYPGYNYSSFVPLSEESRYKIKLIYSKHVQFTFICTINDFLKSLIVTYLYTFIDQLLSYFLTKGSTFQVQGVVPYLICLMDDPIGKEADWETNIGDKKHVNKCIN